MVSPLSEVRTPRYCIHPYFGFVCTPNSVLDFSETISASLDHPAIAHIDAWGFRNRDLPVQKPEGETWIGVFGGSVAFSVASSSNETTIAGYLEVELNARAAQGRRIRVLNLALPAGQQPQSLLIFAMKVGLLDGAVIFDGVNEAIIPAYYNRSAMPVSFPYRPFYETLFARSLTEEQRAIQWNIEDEERAMANSRSSLWSAWQASRRRRHIEGLRNRLKGISPSSAVLESIFPRVEGGIDEHIDAGIDNWRDCTRTMHALARATKTEIVSILQPMPEREKPLTERERRHIEAYPDVLAIRARGYTRLSAHTAELAAEGVMCLDFAGVFANRSEDMYVDIGHFNDRACQIVAQRIAADAVGSWACVSGPRE